jgi:hypothetical protein
MKPEVQKTGARLVGKERKLTGIRSNKDWSMGEEAVGPAVLARWESLTRRESDNQSERRE